MKQNLELSIEEVVVPGSPGLRGEDIHASLIRALENMFMGRGKLRGLGRLRSADELGAGSVPLAELSSGEKIGERVAHQVYGALSDSGEGGR